MEKFNILQVLDKMKKGTRLTEFECREFIKGCSNGTIPDYQITAFLMAAAIHDMSDEETIWMTEEMTASGSFYRLPEGRSKDFIVVDKHSSGGVGDKMTITLSPLLACAGLKVLKLSGRGLSFSGGTIDKLDSMGLRTSIPYKEALEIAKKANIAVFSPTADVAPADKILYVLQDVTSTADSIALIASSIMSKKLAFESDYIFLDVKYGTGAFCVPLEMATKLAQLMTSIGKAAGRNVVTHLSSMQHPLGHAIGNTLEVLEVQKFFKGEWNAPNYKQLVLHFVGQIYVTTGKAKDLEEAKQMILNYIADGSALKALETWLEAQGTDIEKFRNEEYFAPKHRLDVKSPKDGHFGIIDTQQIGHISNSLGAGRIQVDDEIDIHAGIFVHKQRNDLVKEGDVLYTLYSSNPIDPSTEKAILATTDISPEPHKVDKLIFRYED